MNDELLAMVVSFLWALVYLASCMKTPADTFQAVGMRLAFSLSVGSCIFLTLAFIKGIAQK